MGFEMYNFLIHFTIFCIQYLCVNTNPLIGINVQPVNEGECPFIISLNRIRNTNVDRRSTHACTGTLISQQDVLTSEHCVVFENLESTQILTGSNDLRQCIPLQISWWISYEQWAAMKNKKVSCLDNDIALIRLSQAASNQILPARLTEGAVKDFYGLTVTAVGWGRTNQSSMTNVASKANLRVLSYDECVQRVRALGQNKMPFDKKQILCTISEPYTLLNDGDSGGPLLFQNEIIGVNKGTFPMTVEDRNPNLINIHVSVMFYKKFLIAIMND